MMQLRVIETPNIFIASSGECNLLAPASYTSAIALTLRFLSGASNPRTKQDSHWESWLPKQEENGITCRVAEEKVSRPQTCAHPDPPGTASAALVAREAQLPRSSAAAVKGKGVQGTCTRKVIDRKNKCFSQLSFGCPGYNQENGRQPAKIRR